MLRTLNLLTRQSVVLHVNVNIHLELGFRLYVRQTGFPKELYLFGLLMEGRFKGHF